ncbi:MAG: hypothetical protein N0C84_00445 [Candidatus Thiodiazotropha taylori]|uniref:Uncharacterized protein n=1 Tax=Candidatus Thiodiazotropha taylori TaxID=2792791 RepID=A0A9E4KAM9_9GAMM|nr:hypothetical protein [Candidatus Thiodiazotropha taylori]MCW4254913.1 hypothetical protein [Candidatus Thiodiazotropha taylori]
MLAFNDYLKEMALAVRDLDLEFIKKAEVVTSFNIPAKEYEHTKYKEEIQYLICKHFFPKFDLQNTIKSFDTGKYNNVVKNLKAENKVMFEKLFRYQPKGVGPGEIMMYFICDDATLGGGSSAGLDITSGGKGYEVKACALTREGFFENFRIGGTVNISSAMRAASDIKVQLGLPGRETEIGKQQIASIKKSKLGKDWIQKVEKPYKEKVLEYFTGHETIFLINSAPKSMLGEAFAKTVRMKDIELGAVTNGTMKPMIRR